MNVSKMQNLFTSFSNHRLLNIFSQLWPRDVVLRQRLSWFNFHANPLHFTLMKKESLALFSQDFFCRKSGRSYSYPKLLTFCKLRLSWISYISNFSKRNYLTGKYFQFTPLQESPSFLLTLYFWKQRLCVCVKCNAFACLLLLKDRAILTRRKHTEKKDTPRLFFARKILLGLL